MKFSSLKAFQKHVKDALPNHLSPLYVLLSKEEHSKNIALKALSKGFLPHEEHLELFTTSLYADKVSANQLLDELFSYSLFHSKRLILLNQVEKLTKQHLQVLKTYFSNPSKTHLLVLIGSQLPKDAHFYKKLEQAGIILDVTEQKPWDKEKELVEWMQEYLKTQGKLIDPALALRMVKAQAQDPLFLKNELDKLLCYIGQKQAISIQDLIDIGAIKTHYTPWQLVNAILENKTKEALKACQSLLKEGSALIGLLRLIRNQVHLRCCISAILAKGGTRLDVSQAFPSLKSTHLDQHIAQAQLWGSTQLEKTLLLIDETELKAKSENVSDELLFEQLIAKLHDKETNNESKTYPFFTS